LSRNTEVRRPRAFSQALQMLALAVFLAGCSGFPGNNFWSGAPPPPPKQPDAIGSGQVKIGLILPLSAPGNTGPAAQSMKNAAEMAMSEFTSPNIQLLLEDDAGSASGAQSGAQQAIGQGAELLLGPLFAQSVGAAAQSARPRGIPIIAFSTDASVAASGVYLLSFLPESEVDRIVDYAVENGKRSFAALMPENAYGSVVDAEFRQAVARKGARLAALEHYPADKAGVQEPVRRILAAADQIDSILIPDSGEGVANVVQALAANGLDRKRIQLMGTGLWDEQRIFADPALQGAWFAAPDPAGYRRFVGRYRNKYNQEPVRTATLAYDAVSLAAALVKAQGAQRFSQETLTNPSGFSGIDGIFRFRPEGTNQRGLAVLRVEPGGAQVISQAPRAFGAGI
jgi:ABC-type branched-subunit amino acid transport system substrate-binding protein